MTREMLEQWRDVYRYFEHFEPPNPTAPGRAAFLDELLRRFFPTPAQAGGQAVIPAASAAVAPGTEELRKASDQSGATSAAGSGAGGGPVAAGNASTSGTLEVHRRFDGAPSGAPRLRFGPSDQAPPLIPSPRSPTDQPPTVPIFQLQF
ncbi:MAG TPA: hypothetical protein VIV12_25625 [Streptosporangiaceae bacterium]